MNILFGADVSISKVIGGAERVLFEQSTRLSGLGHRVHILTRRLPFHERTDEAIAGVHEWRYDVQGRSSYAFIRSTRTNGGRLFAKVRKQLEPDIINFHQPFTAYAVNTSVAGLRTPKIYTVHSLSFEEFLSRTPRPAGLIRQALVLLNARVRRIIERRDLEQSDHIIVLSRFTQGKLQKAHQVPAEKISIIPGGVDLEKFHPATDKSKIRHRLSVPEDRLVLLTVRNLVPRMGLENLIAAFSEVIRSTPQVHLVIGGEGPLKTILTSLAEKLGIDPFISFAGFIPEADLADTYRMADVFILPTIELEGFGLVTLEALASGLPVLGTPVGGTVEILDRLDRRFIFADTRPESLARLMTEFCREFVAAPEHLQNASARCRAFVEEYYSWERNVEATQRLFADQLPDRRSG